MEATKEQPESLCGLKPRDRVAVIAPVASLPAPSSMFTSGSGAGCSLPNAPTHSGPSLITSHPTHLVFFHQAQNGCSGSNYINFSTRGDAGPQGRTPYIASPLCTLVRPEGWGVPQRKGTKNTPCSPCGPGRVERPAFRCHIPD
jgi:hypothetical protein